MPWCKIYIKSLNIKMSFNWILNYDYCTNCYVPVTGIRTARLLGPISHPVVKSVVKCMVITRLTKWFVIELYCVSTDRVSDLVTIEWFCSQRLTTCYLVVLERRPTAK